MGEMLDNIELNVMHTVDHVEKARDETKRAMKYQGQARKNQLSLQLGLTTLVSRREQSLKGLPENEGVPVTLFPYNHPWTWLSKQSTPRRI